MPALPHVTVLAVAGVAASLHLSAATYEDYEHAREAVERGEILPLTEILERVEARHGGRMIEVEFESADSRWFYELELIQPDGRIIEVTVDAVTGETLRSAIELD
jgi:uncharacterized membrane protein YkoI